VPGGRVSVFNLILALFAFAGVTVLVFDHRRGWLTQILVDSLRQFESPRIQSSEQTVQPSEEDET